MAVEKGDTVKVEYTGMLEDGKVFDSSEGKEPLEFIAGNGDVIKGFDEAVIGMNENEEKNIHIDVKDAYGPKNENLIQKIPKDKLPKEPEAKKGMVLALTTSEGQKIPAKIIEVSEQDITIDMNHPLAGKNLNFRIKIIGIEKGSEK